MLMVLNAIPVRNVSHFTVIPLMEYVPAYLTGLMWRLWAALAGIAVPVVVRPEPDFVKLEQLESVQILVKTVAVRGVNLVV